MVKILCPTCNIEGTLQKIGLRYYRIKHYDGMSNGKTMSHYHQVPQEYAEKALQDKGAVIENQKNKIKIDQLIDQNTLNIDLEEAKSSYLTSKLSGRSLVWLGHQPPTLTTRVQIPATALNKIIYF